MLAIAVALSFSVAMTEEGDAQMSRFRPVPEAPAAPDTRRKESASKDARQALPYARGRRFASLDEYLAFRRTQGAIDLPWYEEVSPDVFELRTSMRPAPAPQRFTRAQLARKFGFAL